MTKFILIIFLLLYPNLTFSQGKIFFDVKTKLVEKAKLTHIKTTTVYMLTKTNWAGVTEGLADYQLWLKNYKKKKENDVVTINIDVELRTVRAFGEGELLKSVPIEVIFVLDIDNERADSEYEFYKKKFSQFSFEIRTEAYEVSDRILGELTSFISEFVR